MKSPFRLTTGLVLLLAVGATPTLRAEQEATTPRYRITDLGVLSPRANSYVINSSCLNLWGTVVGWSNDGGPYDFTEDSAFVWSPRGGLQSLPGLPGAVHTAALAVNERGVVVGMSGSAFPESRPVLWDRSGVSELPLPTSFVGGMAYNLNRRGMVVGFGLKIGSTPRPNTRPLVWRNGQVQELPLAGEPGPAEGAAYGVNDRGTIVGMSNLRPAIWKGAEVITLPTFGGGYGQATSVNEWNEVVGFSETADGPPQAFRWENGSLQNLSAGEPFSVALSINNRGRIVGAAATGNPGGDAVLWMDGQRLDLADTLVNGDGWVLLEADCINELGLIAGYGVLNGQARAYLLTPVPSRGRR